jgi:Skp family chaperone for outer membrane proteins
MSVPGLLLNVGLGLLGANQTEARSSLKQGKQDFEQLLESIQKGDLAGAQQALTALQQVQAAAQNNLPTSTTSATVSAAEPTVNSPLATDLSSLGAALKSGSLTGAQDAFAKLQQDLKSLHQQSSQYGSLGHAAEVYSVLQQLGATGASDSTTGSVSSFVSTIDKVNGDVGSLQQALQSGNQSLSQDALTRLLQDLRASSLQGKPPAIVATEALAGA